MKLSSNPLDDVLTCPLTVKEHAMATILAQRVSGIGFRCEDAYKGLIEIVYSLQRIHGFAPYTPTGVLIDLEADARLDIEKRELDRVMAMPTYGTPN